MPQLDPFYITNQVSWTFIILIMIIIISTEIFLPERLSRELVIVKLIIP